MNRDLWDEIFLTPLLGVVKKTTLKLTPRRMLSSTHIKEVRSILAQTRRFFPGILRR